jgi:hypothetical protein
VESFCEFSIEPSFSIKCWKSIDCPNNWGPLKWCSAPESELVHMPITLENSLKRGENQEIS